MTPSTSRTPSTRIAFDGAALASGAGDGFGLTANSTSRERRATAASSTACRALVRSSVLGVSPVSTALPSLPTVVAAWVSVSEAV